MRLDLRVFVIVRSVVNPHQNDRRNPCMLSKLLKLLDEISKTLSLVCLMCVKLFSLYLVLYYSLIWQVEVK
jgi:hypothetical protein